MPGDLHTLLREYADIWRKAQGWNKIIFPLCILGIALFAFFASLLYLALWIPLKIYAKVTEDRFL